MQDITALSLWQKGLRHNYITADEIRAAEEVHKGEDAKDILLFVYEAHLKKCADDLERFGLLTDIRKICLWRHDDIRLKEVEKEISETDRRLNNAWQEKYNSIDHDKVSGLLSDERKELREKAVAELDDEWEKELDAHYRSIAESKK